MGYKSSVKNWEGLAKNDALWSILTDKSKKGEKWDIEQFFKSGQQEVDDILDFTKSKKVIPVDFESALDFGCGAGRISRGLSSHYKHVTGVDASPTMIKLAKEGNIDLKESLDFVLNQAEDLSQFASNSFSLAFSVITLQHIPSDQSVNFIKEFVRIIKPGGLAIFQVPTKDVRKLSFSQRVRTFLRIRERLALIGIGSGFNMDMHPVSETKIKALISQADGELCMAVNTNQTEPDYNGHVKFLKDDEAASGYLSRLFVVTKK